MNNIVIRNSQFLLGDSLPGVILCNATNPCKNIQFEGVQNTGKFSIQPDYYCQNAQVVMTGTNSPIVNCSTFP
jgi:hypothetical protein